MSKEKITIDPSDNVLTLLNKQFIKKNKSGMISTIQLAQFIKENQNSMRKLVTQSFKDGGIMTEHNVYPDTYYNRKFGNDKDQIILYIPVIGTYTYDGGKYEGKKTARRIGHFRNIDDLDRLRHKNYHKKELTSKIYFTYEIPSEDVIDYKYASNELLFAFLDIIKSQRILPTNNLKLVKRFIKVYRDFIEFGIGRDDETRYKKIETKQDRYPGNYTTLELLETMSGDNIPELFQGNNTLYFWVNTVGKINSEYRIDTSNFIPKDEINDGREYWGLQTNKIEQDKKTIESMILSEDEIKQLEQRVKLLKSNDKTLLTYTDIRNYPIEFHELLNFKEKEDKPKNIKIDLENHNEKEFTISSGAFGWFDKSYGNVSQETNLKEFYNQNKEKFKSTGIQELLFVSDYDFRNHRKITIETGIIEKIKDAYYYNHSKSSRWDDFSKHHEGFPYFSVVNKFETVIHNKIWAKIHNQKIDLFTRYGSYNTALNYENQFYITRYPVIKVENTFYILRKGSESEGLDPMRNGCLIVTKDSLETFHYNSIEEIPENFKPFEIMLDHIIKNNGEFTITNIAVKTSIKHKMMERGWNR